VLGLGLSDVVLTRDELAGLMAGLLVSDRSPTGHTRFSGWISANSASLGRRYASEIGRHYCARPKT
jgi:NADH dehydrogenase